MTVQSKGNGDIRMRVCVAVAAAWTAGVAGAGTPGCGEWEVLPIYGGGYMQDVVIAPSATNVWYTHADVCGPFRSDDAGKSWRPLHQHFPVAWRQTKVDHVRGILVDPRNANRVLVAGGDVWDYTGGGIVVSDDGGETWRMTLKGAHFYGNSRRRMHGRVLSRDPFDVDTIVAGEDLDGIWLSCDNGETWRNVGLSNHWFTCVAFDTAVRGRIWATAPEQKTDSPQDGRLAGFYRSDDYGATWTAIACDNPPWEFTQLKRGGPIVAIFDRMYPRALSADGLQWTDWFDGLPIRSTPPKNAWDKGNFFALGANADFYLLGDGAGQIWRRGRHDTRWTQRPLVRRAVGALCRPWRIRRRQDVSSSAAIRRWNRRTAGVPGIRCARPGPLRRGAFSASGIGTARLWRWQWRNGTRTWRATSSGRSRGFRRRTECIRTSTSPSCAQGFCTPRSGNPCRPRPARPPRRPMPAPAVSCSRRTRKARSSASSPIVGVRATRCSITMARRWTRKRVGFIQVGSRAWTTAPGGTAGVRGSSGRSISTATW